MTNKEKFIELVKSIDRPGVQDLLDWLEDHDFYTCPASTRYHGSYPGGLLEHSLHVYEELRRLLSVYPEVTADPESAIICALFHDLCKVGLYRTEARNRKVNGRWESYDVYVVDEDFAFGGHGSKSLYLVQKFIPLKDAEAVAINCHMSCWDGNTNVGGAYKQYPFAWLLHVADESATYLRERD